MHHQVKLNQLLQNLRGSGTGLASLNYGVRFYSGHVIAFISEVMAERGVPVALALAGSGIDAAEIRSSGSRFSVSQILAVIGNAIEYTPGIALAVGARYHISACGIFGYAMLSSPSREDLLNAVAKYNQLVDPLVKMIYVRSEDISTWILEPNLACATTDPLYHFVTELKISCFFKVTQELYGETFKFTRVRLRYPAPPHAAEYAKLLNCGIEFDQAHNEISFSDTAATKPKRESDAITHGLMLELCEQEQRKMSGQASIAGAVRMILLGCQGAYPSIDEIAHSLSLNERTLRRKLEAEGTSYSAILSAHRMQLALSYLKTSSLNNHEIAARLGYSDATNFRRAFVSWAGAPPSHFRRRRGPGAYPA